MSSRMWVECFRCLAVVALLASCEQSSPRASEEERDGGDNWVGVCVDADGDGYGFQCDPGPDCDEENRDVHTGCVQCAKPSQGCGCSAGSEPVACHVDPELTPAGSLLCKEGLRYCRDKTWSACEGISTFLAPAPSKLIGGKKQALTGDAGDAGTTCGNACNPDCYVVQDTTSTYDGGRDAAVVPGLGGGITLYQAPGSGPAVLADAGLLDDYVCTPGVTPDGGVIDLDCDKIPDSYDPYPESIPFQTDHKTIFMELGPGQSANQNLDIKFGLKSADVYFYLDMTGTMVDERVKLLEALTTGNRLPSSWAMKDCSDRDFDGTADNNLKELGVVGAIACMISDARFGTGLFRDIPFYNSTTSLNHAPDDYEAFENRVDISNDIAGLNAALSSFVNIGAPSGSPPEGGMQGLWALATGKEWYVGWNRPGNPARPDCPAGTFGGACFRSAALPIIIHITDEAMLNGPPTAAGTAGASHVTYGTELNGKMFSGTTLDAMTGNKYGITAATAETVLTPQPLGAINGRVVTYTGNTTKMAADHSYFNTATCPAGQTAWSTASQGAGDVAFEFQVTDSPKNVLISTSGSRFDSSWMLFKNTAPLVSSTDTAGNATFTDATSLGLLATGQRKLVNGDLAAHPWLYSREMLSTGATCFSNVVADDLGPAAVHKFQLNSATMNVKISTSAGSAALFRGTSIAPTTMPAATLDCGSGASANCNDKIGQFSFDDMVGKHVRVTNADLTSSNLAADYTANFSTCTATYTGTQNGDQAFDFSLSAATTVRVETSGISNNGLSPGFRHGVVLLKKPSGASPTSIAASGNPDQSTAFSINPASISSTTGDWVTYTGSVNLTPDNTTYLQSEVGGAASNACHNGPGGPDAGKDVVFSFVAPANQKYEFETAAPISGSGFKTYLSLHAGGIGRSRNVNITNPATPNSTMQEAGTVDRDQLVLMNGQMDQHDRTIKPSLTGTECGSTGNNSTNGGRDASFRIWVPSSTNLTFSVVGPTGAKGTLPSFDSYVSVYKDSVPGTNRVSGSCPKTGGSLFCDFSYISPCDYNPETYGHSISLPVTGGNYYTVVVKEWQFATTLTAAQGKFGLIIEDSRFASSLVQCDQGSAQPNTYSRITATLTSGTTYYIVVKAPAGTPTYNYALKVRRAPSSVPGLSVEKCADSDPTTFRVAFNQPLSAGDYTIVVKGQRTGSFVYTYHEGPYNLTVRDTAVAPEPLGCFNSGTSGVSSFTVPALPQKSGATNIDYYVVTRSNASTGGGKYWTSIEETSAAAAVGVAYACQDTGGLGLNAQRTFTGTTVLPVDTYRLVVKGTDSTQNGMFQVTVADTAASVVANSNFVPKNYQSDVKPALLANSMKVITVASVNGGSALTAPVKVGGVTTVPANSAYKQSFVLAKDTGAPTKSTDETYHVNYNGEGVGEELVSAVSDLVDAVTMDLTIQLTPRPGFEAPSKPFTFAVQALSAPTGNCSGRTAGTHLNCGPGSRPQFRVTITNPAEPNDVPMSMIDPKGGYTMQLELVGTTSGKTYTVDTIPVYIIPKDVIAEPTTSPQYAPSGSFNQLVGSDCSGTSVPVWSSLYWDATMFAGTSLEWRICTEDANASVPCTPALAGTVTTTAVTCTPADAATKCPNGYCASSGICETVVGPACLIDADCGKGGTCLAPSNTCRWSQNPIDLLPALKGGSQGKEKMRVNVTMNANADRSKAPAINSWRLEYRCSPGV